MASEETGELSVTVPRDVNEWLERRAADEDTDKGTVLRRLLEAAHAVEQLDDGSPEAVARQLIAPDDEVPPVVERRIDDLDDRFTGLIEDVRERVIQVKREADGKAPADHDHPSLDERVDAADAATDRLDEAVDDLDERVDGLDRRLDAGFENYEDVLEYLTDATDDLQDRTDLLARAVVDVREEVRRLAGESGRRAEAEALQLAANRSGVRVADCEDCGAEVDVALLSAPRCPHCASTFNDVRPKQGFLGSPTLLTGEPPALESGSESDLDGSLDDLVADEDGPSPPDGSGRLGVDGGEEP
ncbi:hypothetical protein [Halostella litorea]|uniref:hypothetical protein n=1 Tax=Halostella litorea TaxID=2528831 RepID=UPI001092B73A|nr:hypothetical protein [Halostella litorea]